MAGESEMRMFQVNADGRHRPGGLPWRLARLLWAWTCFLTWRLATVVGEFFSPSRLRTAFKPREGGRRRPRGGTPVPPGDERLDRFG